MGAAMEGEVEAALLVAVGVAMEAVFFASCDSVLIICAEVTMPDVRYRFSKFF